MDREIRKPLDTGLLLELPPEILTKWCDFPKNGTFARMGVNGEGSCFFHSFLSILNPHNFINLREEEQIKIANKFRCTFSEKFTLDEFDRLSKRTEKGSEPRKLRGRGSNQKKQLQKEFKKAQSAFCKPSVWADETNIRFVSKLLNLNLVFVDFSRTSHVYCTMHGDEALHNMEECDPIRELQKTGIIAWIDKSHFEPIVRIDNSETGEITGLFDPSVEKDAAFLQHFMTMYKKECNL